MPYFKTCIASICIYVVIAACNTQPAANLKIADTLQYSADSSYGIILKKQDDTAFVRLMQKAQAELPVFVDSLKQLSKNPGYRFAIKSAFTQNEETEHMWSEITSFDGKNFTGIFTDSAYVITNIKTGDPVSIKKDKVEDWIIFDNVHEQQYGYFSKEFLHDQ